MSAPGPPSRNAAAQAARRPLHLAALGAGWSVFVIANAQRIDVVPFFTRLRAEYGVDYAGVGALLSAYLLGYVLGQVPMGLAADNLPTRRVTVGGLALMVVTSGLFALTRHYWLAMLWRFLMGIGGAALYSSTVKQLLAVAPSRGTAMGVLQSGAAAGTILGLLGLPLVAIATGVRPAFGVLTAMTAATCAYAAACLPAAACGRAAAEPMRRQVGAIVRDPLFRSIASCTAFVLFGVYGVTAWIPTYLQTEFRFTSAAAGGVAALINVGLAVASPAAGALSDRLGVRGPVIVVGVAALALACVGLAAIHSAPAVALCAVVAGVGIALTLPILTTLTTDAFGVGRAGVAISLNLAIGQLASTISGVLFGGLLDATHSFPLMWTVGAAVVAAGLVPAVNLRAGERAATIC